VTGVAQPPGQQRIEYVVVVVAETQDLDRPRQIGEEGQGPDLVQPEVVQRSGDAQRGGDGEDPAHHERPRHPVPIGGAAHTGTFYQSARR
jgi:hypothetical protein